jgi:hypothetical protein
MVSKGTIRAEARRVLITIQPVDSHARAVQPIALALARLGHHVRVAVAGTHCGRLRDAYTLPVVAAGENWTLTDASKRLAGDLIQKGNEGFCRTLIGDYLAGGPALQMARDILTLSRDWRPEIIYRDCTEFGGYLAGESLGVPVVSLDNGFHRLITSHHDVARPALDTHRAALGLGPEPRNPPPDLILTPAPRSLLLHDVEGRITEYQHENPRRGNERLPAWIANLPTHSPLIYVSLGSLLTCGPGLEELAADVYERIIDALNGVNCTAIVAVGGSPRSRWRPARHVRIVAHTAQPTLLQAGVDLFISHAGFGSLREALSARVPTVLLPFCSDQPLNAARWAELELGVRLDPTVSADEIRKAIGAVLAREGYRGNLLRWQRKTLALPPLDSVLPRLMTSAFADQP